MIISCDLISALIHWTPLFYSQQNLLVRFSRLVHDTCGDEFVCEFLASRRRTAIRLSDYVDAQLLSDVTNEHALANNNCVNYVHDTFVRYNQLLHLYTDHCY